MQLTYNEAPIEHTEMGYSIASQDRLWIVFMYDLSSEDEYRYSRLYPRTQESGGGWSYELMMEGVLVWTTRTEAEAYAKHVRSELDDWFIAHPDIEEERFEVYVMNLGDDARWEDLALGGYKRTRQSPKFKGSEVAWQALFDMHMRWREANTEKEATK